MNKRPMGVFKKENDYQKLISREAYEDTPKAVFAALFVSLALNHVGISPEEIDAILINEWRLLWEQDIVPQAPFGRCKSA